MGKLEQDSSLDSWRESIPRREGVDNSGRVTSSDFRGLDAEVCVEGTEEEREQEICISQEDRRTNNLESKRSKV